MNRNYVFLFVLIVLIAVSIGFLIHYDKAENVPSVFFSALTTVFAFHAYLFTKEKFRLDLLEKRWSVYEQTLKFCSIVLTYGGLPSYTATPDKEPQNKAINDALLAANNSFRGIGYHKTRSMFGKDIEDVFSKLNESYSWIISHQNVSTEKAAEQAEVVTRHLKFIYDTVETLPDLFRPYVYFGDYRNN